MLYLKWITPLTLLYIFLTANIEPLNWLVGILLAVGITALIRPTPSPIQWRSLPLTLFVAGQWLLSLLWDLWVSSLQVARLVLQKDISLQQGVFALSSESPHPQVTVLSAQAITLTPGEMVIEIDADGVMYTHSLDVVKTAQTEPLVQQKRAQQLEKIFT
jgi:multisubunit Na+/H+ antiporter MnhE subunit